MAAKRLDANSKRTAQRKRRKRAAKIVASANDTPREFIAAAMKITKPAHGNGVHTRLHSGNGKRIDHSPKAKLPTPIFHTPKTELEQAIQRYVDLFDYAPIGYVTFDRAGQIEEINVRALALLKRAAKQVIGATFTKCVAKEDAQLFLNHLLQCRRSHDQVVTELHLQRPDGSKVSVQLSTTPILPVTKNGAHLYHSAIVDLTEHERAGAALRASEKRFREMIDALPAAVYTTDAKGRVTYFNQACVELSGRTPQLGTDRWCVTWKLYHPDGRRMPHNECPMAITLKTGKPVRGAEAIAERPDGSRVWFTPYPTPLRDSKGRITGGINMLVDITERKQSEAGAQRLAAIVESSHDAVAAKDLDGIITNWNQSAERIFGYKAKEIVGKSVRLLIPADRQKEEDAILERVRSGKSLDHYETVRQRKDGTPIDVALTISPIKDRKGKVVGVSKVARDITKQKMAERRLAEQARLLDLSNDAIIVRDSADRINYWNKGAEEIYGYSAAEALGQVTHRLLKTKFPEPVSKIYHELDKNGRWEGELIHTRRDGTRLIMYSRWSLDRDPGGNRATILETNNDISLRKEAEVALAQTAEQNETLLQFVQRRGTAESLREIYSVALDTICKALNCDRAAILLFDQEGVMRLVDSRRLSARYRKGVEGHSPWKRNAKNPQPVCIPNVDLADLPATLKKTIKREGIAAAAFIPLVAEGVLIGKFMTYYNKPHAFNEHEINLSKNIAGQLALGIVRKSAEEALRESEARLRAVVEQATAGIARADLRGRLLFVNEKFCQIVGYEESELVGRKLLRDITHPDDVKQTSKLFAQLVKHGKAYEIEKRYVRKDGSVIWVSVSASPVRDLRGKPQSAVAVVVDITARKKAEDMLRKSKELLEEVVKQRTKALRSANEELEREMERRQGLEGKILEVSDREQQRLGQELHDGVCQHLTAISFMAHATAVRLRDHRVCEVDDIEKIAELVSKGATDVRNLARGLHMVDVEANNLVSALENLAVREIWKTPVELRVKQHLHIEGDAIAAQIYRIAREAVINANKHARAQKVTIELKRSGGEIVLSISDDGVGLPKGFDDSKGMGFQIMRQRLESVKGRMEIESIRPHGTRLAFYFPERQ